MNVIQLIDLTIKVIGVGAIITAVFQLFETRKKRMVDMYWQISEMYSSTEMLEARSTLSQILEDKEMLSLRSYVEDKDEETKNQAIKEYKDRFHDAASNSKEKQIDRKARARVRFLNQIGILVRKKLIDKDLLFELIGVGLEIDYKILSILMETYRKAHNVPKMYREIDYLFAENQNRKEDKPWYKKELRSRYL